MATAGTAGTGRFAAEGPERATAGSGFFGSSTPVSVSYSPASSAIRASVTASPTNLPTLRPAASSRSPAASAFFRAVAPILSTGKASVMIFPGNSLSSPEPLDLLEIYPGRSAQRLFEEIDRLPEVPLERPGRPRDPQPPANPAGFGRRYWHEQCRRQQHRGKA